MLRQLSRLTTSTGHNPLLLSFRGRPPVQTVHRYHRYSVTCPTIPGQRSLKRTMGSAGSKNSEKRGKHSYSPSKAQGGAAMSSSSSPQKAQGTPVPEKAPENNGDDYIESVVCQETDLNDNEMKVLPLGGEGAEVLVIKQSGVFSAIGTKCSHYGAPLVNGALGNGRVRCPWHGACFNTKTGDIEDFPGMDNIPCYQVSVQNGNVSVIADRKLLKVNKRKKLPILEKEESDETFIVVGGGPAGANCVSTLRHGGFKGKLIFVIGEPYLPYDRIKLSKSLSVKPEAITLISQADYDNAKVITKVGVKLENIDADSKQVSLSNGEKLSYNKLFLATGASARTFPTPGLDLANIFTLRTVEDAAKINDALTPDSNVIILGASFIGMEAATILLDKVKSVTIVAIEKIPFELILGTEIGSRIKALAEEKGVKFQLENGIVEYKGDTKLTSVLLSNGEELPADLCLIGVGVVANTQYLAHSGVPLLPNKTLEVDEYLKSSLEDVYAGGDIVTSPVLGQQANIGHFGLAEYHGYVAAKNMLGQTFKLNTVPFFWTVLFGKNIRYCGYAFKFSRVEVRGDLEAFTAAAFYIMSDETVGAILTVGRDPLAAKFGNILHEKGHFLASDIDSFLS